MTAWQPSMASASAAQRRLTRLVDQLHAAAAPDANTDAQLAPLPAWIGQDKYAMEFEWLAPTSSLTPDLNAGRVD